MIGEKPLPHQVIYKQYIKHEYRDYYLHYDQLFDSLYNLDTKETSERHFKRFDQNFLFSVKRQDLFLLRLIERTELELKGISSFWDKLSADASKDTKSSEKALKTLDRLLKGLFTKCEDATAFYNFNDFSIRKLGFYFMSHEHNNEDYEGFDSNISFDKNSSRKSSVYYRENYVRRRELLNRLQSDCNALYTAIFRKSYSFLSRKELTYQKSAGSSTGALMLLGMKIGIIFTITFFLLEINILGKQIDIFSDPTVYVFSSIGSLLLFRVLWGVNIYLWSYNDVNFISLFDLDNLQPNYIDTISNSMSLLVIYFIILLLYNLSLSQNSYFYDSVLLYLCPMLLVLFYFGYREIVKDIFFAPFVPVTFRANYAGDCLTSFTGILIDSSYTICYFLSGQFLKDPLHSEDRNIKNFGSSYLDCGAQGMMQFASFVQLIPLAARFLQCCRAGFDMKTMWPQSVNALKYASSILVVIVSNLHPDHATLYVIVVAVSLFKWWWDVTMDWGLGILHYKTWIDLWNKYRTEEADIHSYLLRPNRLYDRTSLYYWAILVNLILRFVWVSSLLPNLTIVINDKRLVIFASALEIFRRCMWGHYRVEWEHVKFALKGTPGFVLFNKMPSNVFELIKAESNKDFFSDSDIDSMHKHHKNDRERFSLADADTKK